MASEVHATQLRKGTRIPYLAHLMSVSALVLEHGGGEDAAIGGLLHDAVEDSGDGTQMEARLRREFGDRVADIVMGCSDAVAVAGQALPGRPSRIPPDSFGDRAFGHIRKLQDGSMMQAQALVLPQNSACASVALAAWRFSRGTLFRNPAPKRAEVDDVPCSRHAELATGLPAWL